jgi:hypothetical protein
MSDFDKRFQKMSDDFDRDFRRIKIASIVGGVISLIIGLGLTAFFIWVVIVLLRYIGAL